MAAGASKFNSSGGVSLRFPKALGTDEIPNYVTFRPTVVDYGLTGNGSSKQKYGNAIVATDFSTFRPRSSGSVGSLNSSGLTVFNPFEQISKKIGGFVDSISRNANLSFETPLGNIGFDFGAAASGGNILSGRFNLGALNINLGDALGKQGPNTIRKLPGINLYLPQELKNSIAADYKNTGVGAVGQEVLSFVGNGYNENNLDTLLKGTATAILQDYMSDTVSNVAQLGTGRAKNNYTYAIFGGMKHREFSYSFTLIAKDAEESRTIKEICDSFSIYMLPMRSPDDFHFYDTPCMWEISYNRYSDPIKYLDQPNNCFLTAVDITYGKGTLGHTYDDGAPLSVDISLKFTEIEPLLRAQDGDRASINSGLLDQLKDKLLPGDENGGGGGK